MYSTIQELSGDNDKLVSARDGEGEAQSGVEGRRKTVRRRSGRLNAGARLAAAAPGARFMASDGGARIRVSDLRARRRRRLCTALHRVAI